MTKLFFNGTILTQDTFLPKASAMLVAGDKIIAIGTYEDVTSFKTSKTTLIDLQGRTVIPGFNDAHIHVWKVGQLAAFIIDLRGVASIAELQQKVKKVASTLPKGTWIVGRGYNEQLLVENRMPTRIDLDKISLEHPIYLIRTCAHIASTNSFALQVAGIDIKSVAPEGGAIGKLPTGELTGIFYETAIGLISKHIPPTTHQEYKDMILTGARSLLKQGVTSVTDPAVHPELLDAYLELGKEKSTLLRFNLMPILLPDGGEKPYPIPEKYSSPFINIDTVKLFSDGGLSGRTAALKRPYKETSEYGILRLQHEQFFMLATEAQQKGFRIGTHAIGDKAIDLVLDIYKRLKEKFGNTRNRIEHFGLPSSANIQDVADHGFIPVPQPIFLYELGENFISSLDDAYLAQCYPLKTLLQKGIHVALSTDAPVVKNTNPWVCIEAAVTRKTLQGTVLSLNECINVEEAIYGYTMGSAFAEGKEKEKGSLEAGKYADFIVLDRNPLQVSEYDLHNIQVLETYIGGENVYSSLH